MPPPLRLRPSPGVCGGLTFFFNFLVLISGLVIASSGCFIMYYLLRLKIDSHLVRMTAIVIGIGFCLILVSVLAFVGVCRRISWCLTFYTIFLAIILVAEVAAGILFLSYSGEVVDKLKQVLTKIAKGMNEQSETDDVLIKLQLLMGCCGAEGPSNYNNASHFCCQGTKNCQDFPKKGCNDVLSDLLNKYQVPIGVSLILLGAAEVLIVIMGNYTRKNLKGHRRT